MKRVPLLIGTGVAAGAAIVAAAAAAVGADAGIRAVLAYVKSTWPAPERAFQQEVSRRD